MNTCADCEWWDTRGYLPQLRRSPDNQKIQVGNCTVLYGFPHPTPITWADFSCRHHKPRADWADRAAERAFTGTPYDRAMLAQMIREEAAKAGIQHKGCDPNCDALTKFFRPICQYLGIPDGAEFETAGKQVLLKLMCLGAAFQDEKKEEAAKAGVK